MEKYFDNIIWIIKGRKGKLLKAKGEIRKLKEEK